MTTHKSANILCKVKVRGLCLVLLCLHLTVADVPGPCRYSVRMEHLATVRHLTENQLKNGCSITYTFTERGNLSDTCYIKAAFPQILDLIDTHFRFARSSDNGRYVEAMKALIHNVYSQKCIPPINLETEDDPAKFSKTHRGSPREALDRVLKVFSLYMKLMSTRNTPVDWNCEEEYDEDELKFTTPFVQTTGADECQCLNPTVEYRDSHPLPMADSSLWKLTSQTTKIPSYSTEAPGQDPPLLGTLDPMVVHWKTGSTSIRMAHGTDSGNRQMGGVFLRSAESPLLRGVGAEHSSGLSSSTSVKMAAFPTSVEPPLSEHSSVFSEASKPVHYKSQGGTTVIESSVIATDLVEHSTSIASGISRDPAKSISGMTKLKTDSPASHASLVSQITTMSSQVFVGHSSTSALLQDLQVEGIPRRPQVSGLVPLAKRSIEPRQDSSQANPSTSPASPQRVTASTPQLPPAISMMTARKKSARGGVLDYFSSLEQTWKGDDQIRSTRTAVLSFAPKTWLGNDVGHQHGLPTPAVRPTPSPPPESMALFRKTAKNKEVGSADPLGQDAGTHFQSGDSEGSHDSNILAYIIAPACGGLLFISALYCRRRQKVGFRQQGLELQDCESMTEMSEIVVDNCT